MIFLAAIKHAKSPIDCGVRASWAAANCEDSRQRNDARTLDKDDFPDAPELVDPKQCTVTLTAADVKAATGKPY